MQRLRIRYHTEPSLDMAGSAKSFLPLAAVQPLDWMQT